MEEINTLQMSASVAEAYPERGLKAYSIILGAWLALFPASGLLNSTGIFQAYLSENQLAGYSESEVGWIFSIFAFLLFFFGGLQVGPIFDSYGLRLLLPTGAFGLVISLICTSFCKTYYQFLLAFSILGGIASSILWTSSIATLGHWFQLNRGLATGLATTAGGFGGVTFPILFNQLTPGLGFAWSIRCFALLSVFCFLISSLLLKTRLPRNRQARLILDWGGFKDIRFVLTMSAIFILDWAVLVPPAYITTYSSSHGFNSISPHILAILNAASIFGRGIPGPVADRLGRFNVMILCSALCAFSIFGLWLNAGSSAVVTVAFAVLYGFFSGSAYSLTPVCVAQLCRTEIYASRYGTAYGVVSLATLAGIPISGNILSTGNGENYQALILFCGAAYAGSTGLFIVARGVSSGWSIRTKF
uniref:Major facilitator superfamily (MFS) profile domain-containing protein n=1 Tax=Bionectria ochroleuca TaxID=29856 RepID=A0A8H7NI07_BIOOC